MRSIGIFMGLLALGAISNGAPIAEPAAGVIAARSADPEPFQGFTEKHPIRDADPKPVKIVNLTTVLPGKHPVRDADPEPVKIVNLTTVLPGKHPVRDADPKLIKPLDRTPVKPGRHPVRDADPDSANADQLSVEYP